MGATNIVDTHVDAKPDLTKEPSAEAAAKMAAQAKMPNTVTRVDATTTPDQKTERPAWLPEKFKTVEDLAKSYAELEKKQGSKANEKSPEKGDEAKKGLDALKVTNDPAKAATTDATKALDGVGLKMEEFQAEFAKEGKLGDESYSKLEKAGIPKAMVDGFIAGQQALMEKTMADIHSVAGGEAKFLEMHEWSNTADSLTADERAAVNSALDSNDVKAIKLAFQAVHSKWQAAVGKEPAVQLRGATAGGSKGDVYSSRDEMMIDMAKPEYKTNETFRAHVANKLKNSRIL
jgi:hypothetical protein